MFLAVDCGNTNTVIALYTYSNKKLTLLNLWRINSDIKRTSDDYYVWLNQAFSIFNIKISQIKGICIASVVPEVLLNIKIMIKKYFKIKTLIVGEDNINLDINIENPKEAGADRVVNAFAAHVLNYSPAIIIDFGTATTFDIVGKNGSYDGGIIAPGINLSVEALYSSTSRLPKIVVKQLEDEKNTLIGRNTISAIESGVYWGYVCMIEGLISKLKNIYKNSKIIATGGLSEIFIKNISSIDFVEKDLTITGLAHIYISYFKKK